MKSLQEITAIENKYCSENGETSLGVAYDALEERWLSGSKDKETALRLMFLIWYSCSEPEFLTGLNGESVKLNLFSEAFETLGGLDTNDNEVCFTVGLMAQLFPYCIGNEEHWLSIGNLLVNKTEQIEPELFIGRGAYGKYFHHMVNKN